MKTFVDFMFNIFYTWNPVYPTAQTPATIASNLKVHLVPTLPINNPPNKLPDPFPIPKKSDPLIINRYC